MYSLTPSRVASVAESIGSRSSIPYRKRCSRPLSLSAREITSCITTPRSAPTWMVPDGVFESLTTCGPPAESASSSAQNMGSAVLADADDGVVDRTGRSLDGHLVALLVPHQGDADRRLVADAPFARRGLGGTDNGERLFPLRALDDHLRA